MMGIAAAFTPTGTGKVLVVVTGFAGTATAVQTAYTAPAYGTGGAPANGAAATGTIFGTGAIQGIKAQANTAFASAAFVDVLTLVPGTAYWFDIQLGTGSVADQAQIQNVKFAFHELPY